MKIKCHFLVKEKGLIPASKKKLHNLCEDKKRKFGIQKND